MLNVEVVYATPSVQIIKSLQVPNEARIIDVIELSQILKEQPSINLERNKVGIFGQLKSLATHVVDGDRVEIYTPLMRDPKQARLLRVNVR